MRYKILGKTELKSKGGWQKLGKAKVSNRTLLC